MSGINGRVSIAPQGLPAGSYSGQPSFVTTGAPRSRKGIRNSPNSFVSANIDAVAHSFVSPGMWKDSVAAVYADTRTPFHFSAGVDGTVWATTPPDHLGIPAMMTPISMGGSGH